VWISKENTDLLSLQIHVPVPNRLNRSNYTRVSSSRPVQLPLNQLRSALTNSSYQKSVIGVTAQAH
jgi:hypothetical protein